jgi:uncharacterized membrane protein
MWRGHSFARLVNFSDAVTAVAITLLVLHISEIRPDSGDESFSELLIEHYSQLIIFMYTFVVVALMWFTHLRVFDQLKVFDSAVFWLNLLWLFGVVLLPWTSALYGEATGVVSQHSGFVYWTNLAVVTWSGALIGRHAVKNPYLCDSDARVITPPRRGFIFGFVFLSLGIVSLIYPVKGPWVFLVLTGVGIVLWRMDDRRLSNAS